jgi:hypothetical protein
MKTTFRLTFAALFVVFSTSAAFAADTAVTFVPPSYPTWEAPATTVGESWAKGMASMGHAWADMALKGSLAGVNNQEALKRSLENRSLYTSTVWEQREIRDRARSMERQRLKERADQDRQRRQQSGQASQRGQGRTVAPPVRPDARQLSSTGEIRWPKMLRGDAYAEGREELEQLFSERATAVRTGDGSENCRAVQVATKDMLDEIQRHFDALSPQEYMAARRFIRSLGNEAGFSNPGDQASNLN